MKVSNEKVLDTINFVQHQITTVTGSFQMKPSDLGIDEDQLPPSELASLGCMYTIDKHLISRGANIRSQLKARLSSVGLGDRGGYILTDEMLSKVQPAIDALEIEFNEWRGHLLEIYEDAVKERIKSHPKYAESIRRHAKSLDYIKGQVCFGVDVKKFQLPKNAPSLVKKSADKLVDSLPTCAFKDAGKYLASIFKTGDESQSLTRKAINGIKNKLIPKLRTYEFISPKIAALATFLEHKCIEADSIMGGMSKPLLADQDYKWFKEAMEPILNETDINIVLESLKNCGVAPSKPETLF